MTKQKLQSSFFLGLFAAVGVVVFLIFQPYFEVLAIAAVLAFLMQPVYRRLVKMCFGLQTLAAMLTVVFTALLVLLPLALIGAKVVGESRDLYTSLNDHGNEYVVQLNTLLDRYVKPYTPSLEFDVRDTVQQGVGWVFQNLGVFFSGTIEFVFGLLLGAVALFYFLKDGPSMLRAIIVLSPLADSHDKQIVARLGVSVSSVVRGSLLVALIQGTLTGIGFTIFGVPNAALWGSIAAICALVPGVGTSIVLVPWIIYLYATGDLGPAVGLTIWSVFAVGLIDNLLGPYLVGRGAKLHPVLILFSVIGGISFFGPLGFLFGPLAVSLLAGLIDIYRTILLKKE
ncbi:MAG: AI-2E family transporter [Patescibacteria group bacterium]|jgi:predicted PurR-regulated permease PerM